MALTEIESYLFSVPGENLVCSLAHFDFSNHQVMLRLQPWPDGRNAPKVTVLAVFPSAKVESIEEDHTERESWPLDIIGFDCYPQGDRWRFVLQCDSVEWCWLSGWPTKQITHPLLEG